jgi:hypothetical protein
MKFRGEILRLRLVDLISTGEIEIIGGIKITSMVLNLPCEFGIWSLNSKSSGRDLLGTCLPRFCGMMPLASNHVPPWNITISDGLGNNDRHAKYYVKNASECNQDTGTTDNWNNKNTKYTCTWCSPLITPPSFLCRLVSYS